jgi:hypothetical protein
MNLTAFCKSASAGFDAKAIVRECVESGEGRLEKSSSVSTDLTKLVLRETGVARLVLPPETVTKEDLDRHAAVNDPYIVYEMEGATPACASVSFSAQPNSYVYELNKYTMTFFDIITRENVHNVKYLLTYRNDPRELFVSNSLKEMQTVEDTQFFGAIDSIVGPTPGATSTVTGLVQNINIASVGADSAWNRRALVTALKTLLNNRLPQGVGICNAATFTEFAAMDRAEIGGDLSQKMFEEGTAALPKARALGQDFITSIKNDLFADMTLYLVTEPAFLGKFNELAAPTLYVEKKADIIRCYARETIGMAIANAAGVAKISFTNPAA